MRLNWKYAAVLLGIGWFLGAASGILVMRDGPPAAFHTWYSKRMRSRLYNDLKLTPEQKTQMDVILNATHQKVNEIRDEEQTKITNVRHATRVSIRLLLTPDQQPAFNEFTTKKDAQLKRSQPPR